MYISLYNNTKEHIHITYEPFDAPYTGVTPVANRSYQMSPFQKQILVGERQECHLLLSANICGRAHKIEFEINLCLLLRIYPDSLPKTQNEIPVLPTMLEEGRHNL